METSVDTLPKPQNTVETSPKTVLMPLSTIALAACGGGGEQAGSTGGVNTTGTAASNPISGSTGNNSSTGSNGSTGSTGSTSSVNPTFTAKAANDAEAARFLQQASFGSSAADISTLQNTFGGDYNAWMTAQMTIAPQQKGWDWLLEQGYYVPTVERVRENLFGTGQMSYMLWKQLFSDQDAMRKRMSLALSEFFVTSLQGVDSHWRFLGMADWWDLLVRNTFGNFRTLLTELTLHPAMGRYLNTMGNKKEEPSLNRVPDENYAREILQLFSIGLYQLNPDGTIKQDSSGNKLESYTQSDVTNLARVFTGYTQDLSGTQLIRAANSDSPSGFSDYRTAEYLRNPMILNASLHSTQDVNFLGKSIAGGVPAAEKLKQALDHIFNHPNVAPFFAKQMIQRLVSSNPSAAYVGRVANAFANNGSGVRGDLKAVWRAILTDTEARNPLTDTQTLAGKLREPMLRFIQWGRTFDFKSRAGSWVLGTTSEPATQLGQSPLNSPSVFNFFRPGFTPPRSQISRASTQAVAPEFQLVNETTTSGYLNFMMGMIWNGSAGRKLPTETNDLQADYSSLIPLASDAKALVARINLLLCANQLSSAAASVIEEALNTSSLTANSTETQKLDRIKAAIYLVMASSDYLIQK